MQINRKILITATSNKEKGLDVKIATDKFGEPEVDLSILTSAISLFIKGLAKTGKYKDHELLDCVISHLHNDFVSTQSFEDAFVNQDFVKNSTKTKKKNNKKK